MDPSRIYTRKIMGLDRSVWMMMALMIILSAGLYGYNIRQRKEVSPCIAMNIFVNGMSNTDNHAFTTGDTLRFRSYFSPEDKVIWDFGDGNTKEGLWSIHTYTREAIYRVVAIVNGKCEYEKKIMVQKNVPVIRDTLGIITEAIIGENEATAGDSISFSTPHEAGSYEWYVEDDPSYPSQSGKDISFTFRIPGIYTVVLVLDSNRDKKIRKTVTILKRDAPLSGANEKPKKLIKPELIDLEKKEDPNVEKGPDVAPPPPPPPAKKYKVVTDEIFKTYLQALVCKEMTVEDFDQYLCGGVNTKVIVNNKQWKSFAALCGEIQGKKVLVESVQASREPSDNCIINLKVSYDKKWKLGRNPCKD